MTTLPEVLELFGETSDPGVRADLLVEFASRFQGIPAEVAVRPYAADKLVPGCESEAYLYALPRSDGTLKLYFGVENPQGLSAKGLAVILDEALSGRPLSELAALEPELVYTIFGKGLSMGKGKGLMGMVNMVRAVALNSGAELPA